MEDVKITVLMPAYNTEKYIREAIDSVLNQTFSDFELLIVNDGSTDATEEIIRSYSDQRIVLINQENKGVSAALNTGLKCARGIYIARFDADDICFPDRLRTQLEFMERHPDYVLTASDAEYIDKDGNFLFTYRNRSYSYEEIRENIRLGCPFIHSTVFYKKADVLDAGGYEPKAHTFEDYLLWTQLIKKGKCQNVKAPMIKVRFNPESVTIDERLRGKRFTALKQEMIFGEKPITTEQENELLAILKSQNFSTFKEYSYYVLIAKKYLWNNPQPALSRRNSVKALQIKPFSIAAWMLLALSILPKKMLISVYQKSKS